MSHFSVMVIGENVEKQMMPYQENNMGDANKKYLKFMCYPKNGDDQVEFDSEEEAKEKLGDAFDEDESYWENPNAKWDWFVEGGRWSNMLINKNGSKLDSEIIKNIDFVRMSEEKKTNAEKTWNEFKEKEDASAFMYGVYNGDTKETYMKRNSSISTFALVKDGKWYEKGSMGWWACVSNEKAQDDWDGEFSKLLEELDENTKITIVDCHI